MKNRVTNRVTRSLLAELEKNYALTPTDRDFLSLYYHRLSGQDYEPSLAQQFLQIAQYHRKLGQQRPPGENIVELTNLAFPGDPTAGPGEHTHIFIIGEDRAFTIESLLIKLNALNKTPIRTCHPVFAVSRDETNHRATHYARATTSTDGDGRLLESHIHFMVDPIPVQDHAKVGAEIHKVLADVRTTVNDWLPMQARTDALAVAVEQTGNKPVFAEYGKFFHWMAEGNFALLGYCELTMISSARVKTNSALGVLRTALADRVNIVEQILPPLEFLTTSPIVFTKSRVKSTIYRANYMDCIMFISAATNGGNAKTIHCVLGFLASSTAVMSTAAIPHLRNKTSYILENSALRKGGYGYKELRTILETLPRDKLLQMDAKSLYALCMTLLNQERRKARLHIHRNICGHFYSCLVYVPRDVFHSELRLKIQQFLATELNATEVEFDVFFSTSILTRIHFIIHVRGPSRGFNHARLEKTIQDMTRSWNEILLTHLRDNLPQDDAEATFEIYRDAFPPAYQQDFSAAHAVEDILRFATVEPEQTIALLHRESTGADRNISAARFRVTTCNHTLALSDVLPILENMGIRIHSVRPYRIDANNDRCYRILDFEVSRMDKLAFEFGNPARRIEQTFIRCWQGAIENDGYNQLTLLAGLSWRRISMIRAYYRYLKQIRLRYSENYIIDALKKNPELMQAISNLFGATFDPRREKTDLTRFQRPVTTLLQQVSTLDEERIIRALLDVIAATLRTNYFQPQPDGSPKPHISIKLSASSIPRIPKPAPMFEIFVYSPRVEGVHLRGGKVARGGLRWSERPDDFRTEVLGLVKAQRVKNAVIVPEGSKGGFVAKQLPTGNIEKIQQEVIACYRIFISGLLDITDNISNNRVLRPANVVAMDEDDPYLVVAADKGTATFSDIANGISQDYGFWLGDAFASGGSAGYDHKKMGITARGAWESVKRHFRELGKDIQNEPFTAIGIGDMSGDVFGNGMLLSHQTRLIAAFNHRHIFIDPNPEPAQSYAERQRLFQLPRSSWSDYNPELITHGGGVYERAAKSIKLSPEAQRALGIQSNTFTPDELINRILRAPVELLWNGGIGTYIKASTEHHSDAQDTGNDAVRVDASELRCRVIGEGGNLGMTQPGRMEYARAGGRCYTDAIDNSAGVDTSDHEVNIKILLNTEVMAATINNAQRNRLLAKMESEVGALVLRNNYQQTEIISIEAAANKQLLPAHARALTVLEQSGLLDREIEFLPDDAEIARRIEVGESLTGPEISVLLSYSKMDLYRKLLASKLPDDPHLDREIERYFPGLMARNYLKQIHNHRLRREIISTQLTNDLVGTMGTTFHLRFGELTNSPADTVAAAYICARELTDSQTLIDEIQRLDNQVPAQSQMAALDMIRQALESSAIWLMQNCPQPLQPAQIGAHYRKPLQKLQSSLKNIITASPTFRQHIAPLTDSGLPQASAEKVARLYTLRHGLDIVQISLTEKRPAILVAKTYFALSDIVAMQWLKEQAQALPSDNLWHDRARFSITTALRRLHTALTMSVLHSSKSTSADKLIAAWTKQKPTLAVTQKMITSIRAEPQVDSAMLSVLVGELERLA